MCSFPLDDPRDFERLSILVKGFSNDTRLALLLGFHHDVAANEIADFLDMTRGGLQNNIEKMIKAELVYRPEEEDQPTYRLTPIGEEFAEFFDQGGSNLLEALNRIDEAEEQVSEEIEDQRDSMLGATLSDRDIERAVHTQKWKRHRDEIQEILPGTMPVPDSIDQDTLVGTTPVPHALEKEEPEYLRVEITDHIGDIQGASGQKYKFIKGDRLQLPEPDALALIERGVAKRISSLPDPEEFEVLSGEEDENS